MAFLFLYMIVIGYFAHLTKQPIKIIYQNNKAMCIYVSFGNSRLLFIIYQVWVCVEESYVTQETPQSLSPVLSSSQLLITSFVDFA